MSENNKPRNLVDIQQSKESRTTEALNMKDEQIRILSEQNKKLLDSLDHVEAENKALQLEKLTIEEQNRQLQSSNFDCQSRARAAEGELENTQLEHEEKEKQLRILTEQNGELLRLLEVEETNNSRMASQLEQQTQELNDFKGQYTILSNKLKIHEELVKKSAHESHLKEEEMRLLKAEIELLKQQNNEIKMKMSVEVDALQEQLRVRKEKQYQLLDKLGIQEEARHQAEDQVSSIRETVRELKAQLTEMESKLQVEISSKLNQLDINRKLEAEMKLVTIDNKELKHSKQKFDKDRLGMESELRENSEQLREMAEKVFQLLERLKLAELGKSKSMDALKEKEQDILTLKKKNSHLIKENTREGKARVQAQMDKKALEEQVRVLKKHNRQLSFKCKEEAKQKLLNEEKSTTLQDNVTTLNGRISFLLNKLQSDEQANVLHRDEIKKMEQQLRDSNEINEKLKEKLEETEEVKRTISQTLKEKEQEIQEDKIKLEGYQKIIDGKEGDLEKNDNGRNSNDKNNKQLLLAEGSLRFFVESKPTIGLITIKAKSAMDREWLEEKGCNSFLKRAFKNPNQTTEILIKRIAEMYGILMTKEECLKKLEYESKLIEEQNENWKTQYEYLSDKLSVEENLKLKTLMKYINAVKASVSMGEPEYEKERNEVGSIGAGRIILAETDISDEEVHAISCTLRRNLTIKELNLRGNKIGDEGARAIASVLSGPSALQNIDLRENRISRSGMKSIIESLERSDRVRHVYVHTGGKIEALGNDGDNTHSVNDDMIQSSESNTLQNSGCTVRAVCVVDVRENKTIDNTKLKNSLRPLLIMNDNNELDVGIDHNKSSRAKAKKLSDATIQKKKQDKMIKDMIEKQNLMKEQGWTGRAGGMQVQGRAKNKSASRSPSKRKLGLGVDQKNEEVAYDENIGVLSDDQEL